MSRPLKPTEQQLPIYPRIHKMDVRYSEMDEFHRRCRAGELKWFWIEVRENGWRVYVKEFCAPSQPIAARPAPTIKQALAQLRPPATHAEQMDLIAQPKRPNYD